MSTGSTFNSLGIVEAVCTINWLFVHIYIKLKYWKLIDEDIVWKIRINEKVIIFTAEWDFDVDRDWNWSFNASLLIVRYNHQILCFYDIRERCYCYLDLNDKWK